MKKYYFAFILIAAAILGSANFVFADSNQTLSITPFIFEIGLSKGDIAQKQIKLTNNGSQAVTLNAQISDFVAGEKDGQPIFVSPNQERVDDPNYSLADWMSISSLPPQQLQPGQSATVNVNIKVPKTAEDGGHYGAILFTYSIPNSQTPGAEIQTKAAVLFFVTTGIANEQGNISNFATDRNLYLINPNVEFSMDFADTGNVHLAPKGIVDIYNLFGHLVAAVPLNRDAQLVLPNSTRSFSNSWYHPNGFGFYTAKLNVYYGQNNYQAKAQKVFWIMPVKNIFIAIIVLILVVLLLWWSIRKYNRWIINKHRKTLGK